MIDKNAKPICIFFVYIYCTLTTNLTADNSNLFSKKNLIYIYIGNYPSS